MQLINAVEAIRDFGYEKNTVVFCSYSKVRDVQIKDLLQKQPYQNIFQVQYNIVFGKSRIVNLLKVIYFRVLICLITLKSKYDACLFSHYWYPNHRYLAYRVDRRNNNARLILVDDGTGTISFYKDRINLEIELHKTATHFDMKTYTVAYWKSGIYSHIPSHLTVYTIYNLQPNINDTLVRNEYKYLLGNIDFIIESNRLSDGSIILLGQSFVEVGILSRHKYEEYLRKIINIYEGSSLYYIPHPAEKTDNFSSELLNKINVIKIDLPVEIYCFTQPLNVGVVGFNTSAIPNIKLIDKHRKIEAVLIDEADILNKSELDRMRNVYEYFKTQKIKLSKV